jgi:hypothetical protein
MKFIKPLIGAAAIVAALTSMASAQSLTHRWDMSSVNDSVGGLVGTVVPNATLTGGVLTPTGNNGLTLPAATVSGINDAFTIETWYTFNVSSGFQTLFSFSNGTNQDYLINVARRGDSGDQSAAFKVAGNETFVTGPINATGVLTQVVIVYDGNTTASFYVNGTFSNSINNVNANFSLSNYTTIGVGGNNPWNDPSVTGTISDFRIYTGALTAGQVSALNGLGADASNGAINGVVAVPEPTTVALLVGAGVAGLVMRRRSRA